MGKPLCVGATVIFLASLASLTIEPLGKLILGSDPWSKLIKSSALIRYMVFYADNYSTIAAVVAVVIGMLGATLMRASSAAQNQGQGN